MKFGYIFLIYSRDIYLVNNLLCCFLAFLSVAVAAIELNSWRTLYPGFREIDVKGRDMG
jgi:hypothetical protein